MKRKTILTTCQKTLVIVSVIGAASLHLTGEAQEISSTKSGTNDVLIIYTSGKPHGMISEMDAEDADAVTCPTPRKENMRTVASELGKVLRSRNLSVRITRAEGIQNRNEILDAQIVVLGSPSYFGNMSWQMKKLIDEKFGAIYASGKKRLGRKKIAVFSMAEVESSARETIRTVGKAIRDCRGVMGPSLTVLTKHKDEEITSRIEEFAGKIAETMK